VRRKWTLTKIERELNRKALKKMSALERQKRAVAQRVAKSVKLITGHSRQDG
jgi:hypothetical protein